VSGRRTCGRLFLLLLALVVRLPAAPMKRVVIGSKPFSESRLLGMLSQEIAHALKGLDQGTGGPAGAR